MGGFSVQTGCCGVLPILTPQEADSTKNALYALLSLYGTVFFWVGTWNICAVHVGGLYDEVSGYHIEHVEGLAPYNLWVPLFFFVGLGLALLTDTMYSFGCVDGSYLPTKWARNPWVNRARVFIGLYANILMWVGIYFWVGVYVGGFSSEGLYLYRTYEAPVEPIPSLDVSDACSAQMQVLCPWDEHLHDDDEEYRSEASCTSCIVTNWDVLQGSCEYAPDVDYYTDTNRFSGTGVLDGLIGHCRTLCPPGEDFHWCQNVPKRYLTKDLIIWFSGLFLLYVSGTFFPASCVHVRGATGWFGLPSLGEGTVRGETEARGGGRKRGGEQQEWKNSKSGGGTGRGEENSKRGGWGWG
jgi:hypothetical protein